MPGRWEELAQYGTVKVFGVMSFKALARNNRGLYVFSADRRYQYLKRVRAGMVWMVSLHIRVSRFEFVNGDAFIRLKQEPTATHSSLPTILESRRAERFIPYNNFFRGR